MELLCDSVTGALLPIDLQTTDDAALLIARVQSFDRRDMSSWSPATDPRAAGEARRHVREQLSTWGLDDLAMTTELLASELIGNVIRHAKGPILLRLLRSRSLICEVYDRSLTTPRIRRHPRPTRGDADSNWSRPYRSAGAPATPPRANASGPSSPSPAPTGPRRPTRWSTCS